MEKRTESKRILLRHPALLQLHHKDDKQGKGVVGCQRGSTEFYRVGAHPSTFFQSHPPVLLILSTPNLPSLTSRKKQHQSFPTFCDRSVSPSHLFKELDYSNLAYFCWLRNSCFRFAHYYSLTRILDDSLKYLPSTLNLTRADRR